MVPTQSFNQFQQKASPTWTALPLPPDNTHLQFWVAHLFAMSHIRAAARKHCSHTWLPYLSCKVCNAHVCVCMRGRVYTCNEYWVMSMYGSAKPITGCGFTSCCGTIHSRGYSQTDTLRQRCASASYNLCAPQACCVAAYVQSLECTYLTYMARVTCCVRAFTFTYVITNTTVVPWQLFCPLISYYCYVSASWSTR